MSKIILTILIALNAIVTKSQEISHEDIYNLLLHSCGNYNLIGWGETQKLHSRTPSGYEWFGWSVSIFGDQLVVGRGMMINEATVYEKENGVWVHKVTLSSNYDTFGQIVDITTDRIIVGAYGSAAFIYEKDGNGVWSKSASLSASNPDDFNFFGLSVGISGDYAVVSDHGTDVNGIPGAGAVYIYERDSNGWSQKQKIIAADPAAGDYFGKSVDIDGELIVVGAERVGYYNGATRCGAVYVFKRNDQGIWIQIKKISGPTDVTYLFLGRYISISGGMIAVGTSGEYLFIYEATGDYTFTHTATLLTSGSGGDVSISEYGEVIIGDSQDDNINGEEAGSVTIFNKDVNGDWIEEDTIISSDSGDHAFGYAVSISGECAAIGKPGGNVDGIVHAGSVYIYCHDHSAHDNSNVVNVQPSDYINTVNNWIFPTFSILFVIVFLNIFMVYYIFLKKTYNNSHQYEPAKRIDELDK